MVRSILIALLVVMIIAAGLGTVSTTTAGQNAPRDIPDGEMRDADGRLFVIIYSEEGVKRCSFDARVSLQDGRVAAVLANDVSDRVGVGSAVADLPKSLEAGRVIPGPVHIDNEGRLTGGYAECETLGEIAHHAGSGTGWYSLYPGALGSLSYRAWTVSAGPVPTQDALLIINDVENVWEPQFNYALVAGGEDPFSFYSNSYNQLSNVNYSRMDTKTQVEYFCDGITNIACFYVTATTGGGKIYRATIVYGPNLWGDPNPSFQHGLAHEFGHGFRLTHHGGCGYVMGPDGCSDLAVAADIATALGDVLGY